MPSDNQDGGLRFRQSRLQQGRLQQDSVDDGGVNEGGAEVGKPPRPAVRPYLTEDELRKRRRPRPIGDVVDRIMTSVAGGRAAPAVVLGSRWEDVVGADYVARTAPGKCQSGRLTILVKDGATASKLRFQTAQILQNAAEIAGEGTVTAISFKVSPSVGQKPTT